MGEQNDRTPCFVNMACVPVLASDKTNVDDIFVSLEMLEDMKKNNVSHLILRGSLSQLSLATMLYPKHVFKGADALVVFYCEKYECSPEELVTPIEVYASQFYNALVGERVGIPAG